MGTLRLGCFVLLVVLRGVSGVGRQHKYFEAVFVLLLLVVLYGVCVVGRQRRYLEAEVFSPSGGLVWRVCSRASAWVP